MTSNARHNGTKMDKNNIVFSFRLDRKFETNSSNVRF